MTRPTHRFVFALTTLLLAGAAVRADVVNWDYSWTMSPATGVVNADVPGTGKVVFDLEHPGSSVNTSDIGAANLSTVSKATDANPATFTTKGFYTLTLTLTDDASGLSGSVTFAGKLSGTLSSLNALIDNAFIGAKTKELILGGNTYDITIGPYVPPGPPKSNNLGSIGAHVDVTSGIHVTDAPEPSTVVLSCLGGLGLFGFSTRNWRRRLLAK